MSEYAVWIGAMTRCYTGHQGDSYLDKYVCEEWLNFQNFADWCQNQKGFENKGWCLDKDLLYKGNKEYGPKFCCFLPQPINASLMKYSSDDVIGYRFNKSSKRWYTSYFDTLSGERRTVAFKTEEDAAVHYKKNRYNKIKQLLPSYREMLDVRVVKRLNEIVSD